MDPIKRLTGILEYGFDDLSLDDRQNMQLDGALLLYEIKEIKADVKIQRLVILDYYNHCKNDMQICGINTRAKKILKE